MPIECTELAPTNSVKAYLFACAVLIREKAIAEITLKSNIFNTTNIESCLYSFDLAIFNASFLRVIELRRSNAASHRFGL